VTIGVLTFDVHLPQARSLKDKRQVIRSVKERLRSRHNVSVSEIGDDADLWQRASIAVVSGHDPLERLFEAVIREVASQIPGDLVETGRDFLDGADGGPAGWEEESR